MTDKPPINRQDSVQRQEPEPSIGSVPPVDLQPALAEEHAQYEQVLESPLPRLLQEAVGSSADVSVERIDGGRDFITIDIKDQVEWNERLRGLVPYLGRIMHELYDPDAGKKPLPTEDEMFANDFDEADISCSDRLLLVANKLQVDGLVLLKDMNNLPGTTCPAQLLQAIGVSLAERKTGLIYSLYNKIFRLYRNAAIVGSSHTPGAIKARCKFSQASGYRSYFRGRRDGDKSLPLDPGEKVLVDAAEAAYKKILTQEYESSQDGMLPGCVTYGEDSIPLRNEHVWRQDGSPLAETFTEMRDWIVSNGRTEEGIFGMLVSVPESAFQEEKR